MSRAYYHYGGAAANVGVGGRLGLLHSGREVRLTTLVDTEAYKKHIESEGERII